MNRFISAVFILLLCVSVSFGATVTVNPAGDGMFVVQGSNMDGIEGLDILLTYDRSVLALPKVAQGALVPAGALFVTNPDFTSAAIKIAIISTSPFSGSGQIAVITFGTHTAAGSVTVSASMINSKGTSVDGNAKTAATDGQSITPGAVGFATAPGVPFSQSARNSSPGVPFSQPAQTSSLGATLKQPGAVSAAPATTLQVNLGTVSMPGDTQPAKEQKPADPPANILPGEQLPVVTRQIEPRAEKKQINETQSPAKESVLSAATLDKFSTYTGEKTPARFIALFSGKREAAIHQEPAVALSDGRTPVRVLIKQAQTDTNAPNFALTEAKLLSLRKDETVRTWIVELLPESGSMQSSLAILLNNRIIVFPLTLAPPVEEVTAVEADFAAFIADSGAVPPRRDLNGDGRHDYRDDFIYTANYLIKKSNSSVRPGPA